jgi:hypothetical protein
VFVEEGIGEEVLGCLIEPVASHTPDVSMVVAAWFVASVDRS